MRHPFLCKLEKQEGNQSSGRLVYMKICTTRQIGIAALREGDLGVMIPTFGFAGQLGHKNKARGRMQQTTTISSPESGKLEETAYLTSNNVFYPFSLSLCVCVFRERRVRARRRQQQPRYQAAVRSLSRCCRVWIANPKPGLLLICPPVKGEM